MDKKTKLFNQLDTDRSALFIPEKIWEAYEKGALGYWYTVGKDFGYQMEALKLLYACDFNIRPFGDGRLPQPTFADELEWYELCEELKLVNPRRNVERKTLRWGPDVYHLALVPIILCISEDLNKDEETRNREYRERATKLKAEFGFDPEDACGCIVVLEKKFAPPEVKKTRRRIENLLQQDPVTVIRVAKFLGMK